MQFVGNAIRRPYLKDLEIIRENLSFEYGIEGTMNVVFLLGKIEQCSRDNNFDSVLDEVYVQQILEAAKEFLELQSYDNFIIMKEVLEGIIETA